MHNIASVALVCSNTSVLDGSLVSKHLQKHIELRVQRVAESVLHMCLSLNLDSVLARQHTALLAIREQQEEDMYTCAKHKLNQSDVVPSASNSEAVGSYYSDFEY